VPYFILWVAYFAQVVVTVFRVLMLAALSPYMMLGFAFGWGRKAAVSGIQTLISTFIVLFASTAVVALLLYTLKSLNLDEGMDDKGIRELADITNSKFMLAVALGWMSSAFLAEANGLANSIAQTRLENTAAGIMVAGASGTATALGKNPALKGLAQDTAGLSGSGVGWAAQQGIGRLLGDRAEGVGSFIEQKAAEHLDRIKKTRGY
jgi:type IV secretion system protein TrbL